MPQSLAQIYLHLVFSTKDRQPFLHGAIERSRMHSYLIGTCQNLECPSIVVGGVEDHVHILCRFGRSISVSDLIRELKRESSKWFKDEFPLMQEFYWQSGYGAFSVSASQLELVTEYIRRQEEHHRKVSFQDEFRMLLKKHGLEWDERYVWD